MKKKLIRCVGTALFLFASLSTSAQVYLLNEDFSGAGNNTPPADWKNIVVQGASTDVWRFDNPGNRTVSYPIVGKFAIFESERFSADGIKEKISLESPFVDCSLGTNRLLLYFDHQFQPGISGKGFLEIYDGTQWITFKIFDTATSGTLTEKFDLTNELLGVTGAKFRFTWEGDGSGYWLVDNIKLFSPNLRDASLVSIDGPVMPFDEGIQPVKVTLTNAGIEKLQSAIIRWTVNGVEQTADTLALNLEFGDEINNLQIGSYDFKSGVLNRVKIWVEQPNGLVDENSRNDTTAALLAAALCGTYTIGGTNPDFTKFMEATDLMNIVGVSCPVVFKVRPGKYNEQLTFYNILGSSAVNTVTFESENGDAASTGIDYINLNPKYDFTLDFRGGSHIIFRNLGIKRSEGKSNILVQDTSNHLRFEACQLHQVEVTPAGRHNNYLTFDRNQMSGYDLLLYHTENAPARGHRITGNSVRSILIKNAREVRVDANSDLLDTTGAHAVAFSMERCRDLQVTNNRFRYIILTSDTAVTLTGNDIVWRYLFDGEPIGIQMISSNDLLIRKNFIALYLEGYNSYSRGIRLRNVQRALIDSNTIIVRKNGGAPENLYTYGILANEDILRNIRIQDNSIQVYAAARDAVGIGAYAGDSLIIRRNLIDGTSLDNPGTGLVLQNLVRTVQVDSNEIRNFRTSGISAKPLVAGDWRFRFNTIRNIRDIGIDAQGAGGMYWGNRILSRSGTGIAVSASGTLVANNFIQLSGSGPVAGISIRKNSTATQLLHNTVRILSEDIVNGHALGLLGGSGTIARNNILSNSAGGMAIYVPVNPEGLSMDYNDYFSDNNRKLASWQGADLFTLDQLQAATGQDAHSLNTNPAFLKVDSAGISNSKLAGAGLFQNNVTTDLRDSLRQDPPTIGALELVLCLNDAGVTEILDFNSSIEPGIKPIRVRIQNQGSGVLNSVTVKWSVNGIAQTPYDWTGTLLSGQDTVLTVGTYKFLENVSYDILATTENPNGVPDCNEFNNTCNGNSIRTPLCGVYTIGGTAPDFPNFKEAVRALNRSGISCPVIFKVRNGVYNEQVQLFDVAGSSPVNTITFESESKDTARTILTYTTYDPANDYTLRLVGARNIIFQYLAIKRSGGKECVMINSGAKNITVSHCSLGSTGVNAVGASYDVKIQNNDLGTETLYVQQDAAQRGRGFRLENNFVKYITVDYADSIIIRSNRATSDTASYARDMRVNNSMNVLVEANRFKTCYFTKDSLLTIRNNILFRDIDITYPEITAMSLNQCAQTLVTGNLVRSDHGSWERNALNILNGHDIRVSRNIFNGTENSFPGTGIYALDVQGPLEIDSNQIFNFTTTGIYTRNAYTSDWRIHHNHISRFRTQGIFAERDGGKFYSNRIVDNPEGTGIIINGRNSMVSHNYIQVGGAGNAKGIMLTQIAQADSILFNSIHISSSDVEKGRCLEVNGGEAHVVWNNIFYNSGGGYAAAYESDLSKSTLNYNDYYSRKDRLIRYQQVNYAKLQDFKDVVRKDPNSFAKAPLFTSPFELATNQSLFYKAGVSIPGQTEDIDLQKHPEPPTLGARELELCPNDAGITEILNLSSPLTQGTKEVRALLQNHGTTPLSRATIFWEVNGVAQTQVNWTGNLATTQEATVSLGNYAFLAGINYTVKAWTASPNGVTDCNRKNDTTTLADLRTALCGIYTIGGTTPDFADFGKAVSALNNSGIGCPVTFKVRNGLYEEQVNLFQVKGSSPVNTIIFEGESLDSSKVDLNYPTPGSSSDYSFSISGADYLSFRNLGIHRRNGTFSVIIENGSHHVSFERCSLGNVYSPPRSVDSALTFLNNNIVNAGIGIDQPAGRTGSNIRVEGNYVGAIHILRSNNILIRNNRGNIDTTWGVGFLKTEQCKNVQVWNNRLSVCYADYDTTLSIRNNVLVSTQDGFLIYNSSNAELIGNSVKMLDVDPNRPYNLGIALINTGNSLIRKNTLDQSLGNPNDPNSGSYGIQLIGSASKKIEVYENNIRVKSKFGSRYGIYMDGADSIKIKNNQLSGSDFQRPSYGILSMNVPNAVSMDSNDISTFTTAGIKSTAKPGSRVLISGNKLHDLRDNGLWIEGDGGQYINNRIYNIEGGNGLQVGVNRALIANNYVQVNGLPTSRGILLKPTTEGTSVVFNSIHLTGSYIQTGIAVEVGGGKGMVVKNNIFNNSGGGYAITASALPVNTQWDYNAYNSSGPDFAAYGTTGFNSMTNWGTLIGGDVNSRKVNPYFKSDTDLLPFQRLLNGAGIASSGILLDIDGELRNQQAPDIGAQEFMVDFGVTRLISPENTCYHREDSVVKVYLRQFGDIPFVNIRIAYQVNDGPVFEDTIPGSINNDIEYAFREPYSLSRNGEYLFKIWLVNSADDNVRNDTLKILRKTKPAPNVNFDYKSDCANKSIPFRATATLSSGTIDKYEWDFGDSTSGSGDSITHKYERSGTYPVILRVYTNEGCYGDTVKTVPVTSTPDAGFKSSAICLNESFIPLNTTIAGDDTSTLTYTWDFGDTTYSSEKNPAHRYKVPGVYTVSMIARANNGCADTALADIEVKSLPALSFDLRSFYRVNDAGVQLLGVPYGGTFSGPGVQGNYFYPSQAGVGTYNITYTYTDPGLECSNTLTKQTTVIPPVKPIVIIQDPKSDSACETTEIRLTVEATGSDLRYLWYKNGTPLLKDTTAQLVIKPVTKSDAAEYQVKVYNLVDTVWSKFATLTFWAKPRADYRYDSSCTAMDIQFLNTSTLMGTGPVRYTWRLNRTLVDTTKDIIYRFEAPATYQLELTVIPEVCPTIGDTITKTVNITTPVPGIRYPSVNAVLQQPITLSARDIGSTYLWTPATGLSSASIPKPTLTPLRRQEYLIRIEDAAGCLTVDTVLVELFTKVAVYVPQGFTPNGDGQNDLLYPILVGIEKVNYFRVYNRWGNLMYETATGNRSEGWDGTRNGIKQPMETYAWICEVVDYEGKMYRYSGNTILIR